MKRYFVLIFIIASPLSSSFAQQITTLKIKKHIKYLSSDKLKGRATSSQQELTAANYISQNFKEYGLLPKGNINSYYYSYKFKKLRFDADTIGGIMLSAINVVAYLDNGVENTVIIGAHFDHLGFEVDKNYTRSNKTTKIYNGADDNASGTAAVLELARYFAYNKRKEKFNFLFICFSGKEVIYQNKKQIYEAIYAGGLVDQLKL